MRSSALLIVALVIAACGIPPSVQPSPSPQPAASRSPVALPTLLPTPQPKPVLLPLIPVTRFDSYREDVTIAGLTAVLASTSTESYVRTALPNATVTVFHDAEILKEVRDREDAVALVFPDQVQPWVKTLSLEGKFWWDPRLNEADYPLRVLVLGARDPTRSARSR